ncbi:MAG: exo-alpha-sialidase [Adhaeribacter sp.]
MLTSKRMLPFLLMLPFLFFACSTLVGYGQNKSNELVKVKIFNYPVLKEKKDNPVVRIEIAGKPGKREVNALKVDLKNTALSDLHTIRVYYTGQDSLFHNKVPFGNPIKPAKNALARGRQPLAEGKNYFWVAYELSDRCNLSTKVEADMAFVQINQKKILATSRQGQNPLRVGMALRQPGDDQVHTYRIPGLTTTNTGALLAIYDARRDSKRDLQGNMDIGLSRSVNGGETWEPMRMALDMGKWGGLPEKFNGVSDACILTDTNTGTIYIAGLWMHGVINAEGKWVEGLTEESEDWNHQWRSKGSQPGFGLRQTSQFLLTQSTDDGKTWSEPVNLTQMIKKPEWWLLAPAPGHGITLQDGTLVFPTQGRDEKGRAFSNITYSKDGGKTWKTSKAAYHNTTENMAVELSDGSIMLNMRDNRNREDKSASNGRAIAVTADLGETWSEHPTSRGALIEPTCMASIHAHQYTSKTGETSRILFFSNPNSKSRRHKQTIKMSLDDGKTWPEKYWIELDEGSGGGYSCLTSIDNNTIGIVYEGSQAHMTFQRIDMEDFLGK